MRGICQKSALKPIGILPIFTPKQLAGSPEEIFLQGKVSMQIRYNDSSKLWVMTDGGHMVDRPGIRDAVAIVRAESRATKVSYAMGKHEWTVSGDVFECNEGQPYKTVMKLSGCNPGGEFTCNDGQCVTMEQRCNQMPNCRDESDEKGCQLLVIKDGYNKKIPPIVPTGGEDFNQTKVGISISLLKIVRMEEVQHKIELQFEITLEWKENRVWYQNLKKKTSLNSLTDAEIGTLWLPYVIYSNTDMKEAVQLEDRLKTTIVVNREGNFSRSGWREVDEIEIFKGKDNTLFMYQTYTKNFQCLYKLHNYPFDTQVNSIYDIYPLVTSPTIFRSVTSKWQHRC